jgi:hypothetical protein
LLVLLDHAIYVAIKEGDRLRVSHDALQRQAKNAGTEFLKLHEKSSSQVDSSARLKLQEDKAKELQQQVCFKCLCVNVLTSELASGVKFCRADTIK